jgi:hypothetical protein
MSPLDARGSLQGCVERGFHILQPTDDKIIDQLMRDKRDRVHPIPTGRDAFIAHRVGTEDQTRQTWVKLNKDGEIAAVLYSARIDKPVWQPSDLCGDVHHILSNPSQLAEKPKPRSFIFYSISSFERGAGKDLIESVHAHLTQHYPSAVLSTLSPLRQNLPPAKDGKMIVPADFRFADWVAEQGISADMLSSNPQELKDTALGYLLENRHVVQRFHMANGAEIGAIRLRANVDESADCRHAFNVMVNYIYPNSKGQLAVNAQNYQKGVLTIHESLLRVTSGKEISNIHRVRTLSA